MSNKACLFAEDTPAPYNPAATKKDPQAHSVFIAGAAYQIPVFWLFCFEEEDFVVVRLSRKESFSTLVAPMEKVRWRLAERDKLARDFFPEAAEIWSGWRKTIEAIDRSYLKLDVCEIWVLYKNAKELEGEMQLALDWFDCQEDYEFTSLLGLAGIDDYDDKTRRILFDEKRWCLEKFVIGWYETIQPQSRPRPAKGRVGKKPK
jgi:hypothetical protein